MRDRTLWTWHVTAGLVVLILLGLHMAIMHLDHMLQVFNPTGGQAEDWANVVARMKSTFFAVSYVLLLGAALYHGLYGLRNILLEMSTDAGLRRIVRVGLWLVGLGLFGYGAYAAVLAPRVAAGVGG